MRQWIAIGKVAVCGKIATMHSVIVPLRLVVKVGFDRPRDRDGGDRPDSPRRPEARGAGGTDAPIPSRSPELPDRATYWAEYKKAVDAEYRAYAIDQGCGRVRETEETRVTPAIERIQAEDPNRHLVGFEFRLKGRERLTEKVANAMAEQPDLAYDNAFAVVKDAIRYTFQYQDDHYVAGVAADTERLQTAGFERVDCRNTWTNEEYKGINSRWRVPENGQIFEVQFHTEASFEAKQETHRAYEKLRDPATPKAEQDKLAEFQREVTARVPVPPRAVDIPEYP